MCKSLRRFNYKYGKGIVLIFMALFVFPVQAGTCVITQHYGENGHNGLDIAPSPARFGVPCYAVSAGTVSRTEINAPSGSGLGGYGTCVVMDHNNGYYSLYAHLQKFVVSKGERVSQGQQVGLIGNTGSVSGATGIHLHLEIRDGVPGANMAGSGFINLHNNDPEGLIDGTVSPIPSVKVPTQWYGGNRYLSETEMYNNAVIIWNYFKNKGWTLYAICAMLGNMEAESGINPNIWNSLIIDSSRAFGLVQWNPSTKFLDWAGVNWRDTQGCGQKALERIDYEVESNVQWETSNSVSGEMTMKDFTQSNAGIQSLTREWLYCYERGGYDTLDKRVQNANKWYNYFQNQTVGDLPNNPYESVAPSIFRKKAGLIYCPRNPLFM